MITAAVVQQAAMPSITGPLRVAGRAGKTLTVQWQCAQPSPMWGVGTGGAGSNIAGITPDGAGQYTIKLRLERQWVIISDVPTTSSNGCASIRVRIVGHKHITRAN